MTDDTPHEAEIVQVGAGTSLLGRVLQLAKQAKQTVGFLPDSAFEQRASRGTLIAIVGDGNVLGYALFDLPGQHVRLVHLVVNPDARGGGHARALLNAIEHHHRPRRGIRLSCRNDYAANSFWPHLGFTPLAERAGRSLSGHLLTTWWRSFHHADLLSLIDEIDQRDRALLDSCVFFDLVDDDPPSYIEHLAADWLADQIHIGITSEVLVEINNAPDPALRRRQRAAAQPLLIPELSEAAWAPTLQTIHELHPDAPATDENDLRQIAKAIAAGARWLITTDDTMRHRYAETATTLGDLRIVAPEALIRDVDEAAWTERYRPVELARTPVTIQEMAPDSTDDLAQRFVNHADGEAIRELRKTLKRLAAQPRQHRVGVLHIDGVPRGLCCIDTTGRGWKITLLRVSTGRGEAVITRHLLAKARQDAREAQIRTLRLSDPHLTAAVRGAAGDEGFLPDKDGHISASVSGRLTATELHDAVRELPLRGVPGFDLVGTPDGPVAAAAAEALLTPVRVLGQGLRTFVVPIKAHWAGELFDSGLAASQLFHRPWDLGLRRELVYYKKPRNSRGIDAPARIVWYVSGDPKRTPGAGTLRAISLLDEVIVGRPDVLHRRFRRLGVYQKKDVVDAAVDGLAMALRFSHTELVTRPVTLAAYRALVARHSNTKPMLRGPELIDERLFAAIHQAGTGG